MATAAPLVYSAHQHTFLPHSDRATTSNITPTEPVQQQEEQGVQYDQYTSLFCRASYDYDAQDASALSFRRGDIIEVLTQQPSGWWDGLLGDERGWFPSNYVTIISDEEAESAFAASEFSSADSQGALSDLESATADVSQAIMTGTQAENEEWLDNELSYRNGTNGYGAVTRNNPTQPSDFWMPEVTPDGQIYYVNTHTGQRSRDLPQEAEDEVSDTDLAGLTSQANSRSATSAGLVFGPNGSAEILAENVELAGFGLPRQTGTPEPWIRKLADDGMSYYYLNGVDGKVQWTRPEKQNGVSVSNNTLANGALQRMDTSRLSVYSDDSDVHPIHDHPHKRLISTVHTNGSRQYPPRSSDPGRHVIMELTSAEKIAKSLQQALAPPPVEFLTDLSAITRSSVQAVMEHVRFSGISQQPEDDKMDGLIRSVVLAVRNLLYISSPPTGQLPNISTPKDGRESKTNSNSPLKPAQRKVTATLSRLVLSARAMQYDSGSDIPDTLSRIGADAEELEKAVVAFVLEVQRTQNTGLNAHDENSPKRLHGILMPVNVGLGLVGAGSGGTWKGFGWVSLNVEQVAPKKVLGSEVVAEVDISFARVSDGLVLLSNSLSLANKHTVDHLRLRVQEVIGYISSFITSIADIHIARHVDIDGIPQAGEGSVNDRYPQTVQNARQLVRLLETGLQAVYDDSSSLLLKVQTLREPDLNPLSHGRETISERLKQLSSSLTLNASLVKQTVEALLAVGHDQADMSQGDYNGSIEWRMSRLSVIDSQFGGTLIDTEDLGNEDMVDFEQALGNISRKAAGTSFEDYPTLVNGDNSEISLDKTLVSHQTFKGSELEPETSPFFEDDLAPVKAKQALRNAGPNKLHRMLGDEYADKIAADLLPWYLRPNYNPAEIIIERDGAIRGGTVPALIERLTAHDQADPTFTKAFLMTYKSFVTLDELFDLLVQRFNIEPPGALTPTELGDWAKLKQHVIQVRVINTFKSMIQDEDVLEKEDLYILDRMKQFVTSDEVSHFAAAKQLSVLIERAQKGGDSMMKKMVLTNQGPPPAPILPRSSRRLKLQEIEPLELARQLTIMESLLYQRIKPMECLQRSREQKTENMDNIAIVIQTSNRIADWVAETILSKEDSRKRAQAVKHLISVADRCRTLNNFSTMIAITSGLNTPPIRRLKRTWEQVGQRIMAQFSACEMTIDSNKNFTKYRSLMANVTPPCVPFIGVFLSTLQFIQDGNPDNLSGGLVNFRKRQMASEVISDIKRWQAQAFNLQSIPAIQTYIEDSLNQFGGDTKASSDHFWALSLEREPREREDEKMARLLQESGFL